MSTDDGALSKRKRPTQQDVARSAGVSQATVSYVLNDRSTESVPEETRQRIRDAVQELGYVPNATARSLRTSKTQTIAGIIPDITNPFYPALERGIQDVARQNNYDLIIYNTDGVAEQERNCLRSVQQARVDGVVTVLFHVGARELFSLLDRNIAVVRVESAHKATGHYPLDNLYVDNVAAAQCAVDYLLQQGYQRIAMISGQEGPGQTRQEGYRRALEAWGQKSEEYLIHMDGFTEQDGYSGMQALLLQPSVPDAVFASNDLIGNRRHACCSRGWIACTGRYRARGL